MYVAAAAPRSHRRPVAARPVSNAASPPGEAATDHGNHDPPGHAVDGIGQERQHAERNCGHRDHPRRRALHDDTCPASFHGGPDYRAAEFARQAGRHDREPRVAAQPFPAVAQRVADGAPLDPVPAVVGALLQGPVTVVVVGDLPVPGVDPVGEREQRLEPAPLYGRVGCRVGRRSAVTTPATRGT